MSTLRQKPEFGKKYQDCQSLPKMTDTRKGVNSCFSPIKNKYYLSKEIKSNKNYNTVSEFSFKKVCLQNNLQDNRETEKNDKNNFAQESPARYNNTDNLESNSSLMNSKILYNMKNKKKDEKKKFFFSENSTKNSEIEKTGFQFESLQIFMKNFRDEVKGMQL